MTEEKKKLTRAFGGHVDDDQNSMTAGERGPVLRQDAHLLEKLAHFDRERIPERVVHAKGVGAHGYFEVTADVSQYTQAGFLAETGRRTEVFVRFSTAGGERGSADAARAASRSSSTRRKATTISSATTHRSSLSAIRSSSPISSIPRNGIRLPTCLIRTCSGISCP